MNASDGRTIHDVLAMASDIDKCNAVLFMVIMVAGKERNLH